MPTLQIDGTAAASIIVAVVGGLISMVGLLIRTMVHVYDSQIRDLTSERDRFRLLAESLQSQLDRNATVDRKLEEITGRLIEKQQDAHEPRRRTPRETTFHP